MISTYKVHFDCIIVSRVYNLFSPYRRSVYLFCFVSVLSSILPISQIVPSITYAISFSLSRTTMSGLFAPSSGHVLSKCWTSQKIFALEFSTVANGGSWRYHGSKFCWFIDRIFLGDGNMWVLAYYYCCCCCYYYYYYKGKRYRDLRKILKLIVLSLK